MTSVPTSTDDRFAQRKTSFEAFTGLPASAFLDSLKDLAPVLARYVREWEFSDVYDASSLDLRTREIIMVAVCGALGATAAPVLKLRIGSALRAGVSRQEIIDTCIQIGIHAGVLACLRRWRLFRRPARCSPQPTHRQHGGERNILKVNGAYSWA